MLAEITITRSGVPHLGREAAEDAHGVDPVAQEGLRHDLIHRLVQRLAEGGGRTDGQRQGPGAINGGASRTTRNGAIRENKPTACSAAGTRLATPTPAYRFRPLPLPTPAGRGWLG